MSIYNHTNHFAGLPQLSVGNTFLPSFSNQSLFLGNQESMDEIDTDVPVILPPEIEECHEAFDQLEEYEWELTDSCKGPNGNRSLGGASALKAMLVQVGEVNDLVEDLPKNASLAPMLNRCSEESATVASIVEMWSGDASNEIDDHLRHIKRLTSHQPLVAHAAPLCLALKKQLEQVILACKQSKTMLLRESKLASRQSDKENYLAAACELKEVIKKAKRALAKCTKELKDKDLSTIANMTYGDEEWERLSSIEPPESLKRKIWNKTTSFLNPLGYIPERWRPSTQQVTGAVLIALVGGEHAINRVENFHASPYLSTSSASRTEDGIIPTFFKYISSFWKVANTDSKTIIEEAREELKQVREDLSEKAKIFKFKEEVEFLRRQVLLAVADTPDEHCPASELFSWTQRVDELCYDLKVLEGRVADLAPAASALMTQKVEEVRALFGNKHTNLLKLSTLFTTLETPGVIVPLPQGISSNQVHAFLARRSSQIFEDWNRLGKLYANYEGREAFLQTEEAQALLASIDAAIARAFEGGEEELRELFTEEFILWVQNVAARGEYLMVRSTGAEDSTVANAGGNVSKAYVKPNLKDIAKAIGEVVRSYSSSGSLQNRINADENPFTDKLQLSVTAQELIGETIGGSLLPTDIPVSMVVFSNEPLFVGGEEFRLMRITAAPGHGEAVVGNLGIVTDSVLVVQSVAHPDKLYILYDNQLKPLRMAPVAIDEMVRLEKLPNTPQMAAMPALSHEMIARLYHVGLTVEKYFGHSASDLEIVVKKGNIYIVQARPVNRPSLLPTYVDMQKAESLPKSPVIKKIQGEIIVPGKASAIAIADKSQMIVANTLEEAERLYLASPPGSVRLVVVGTEEPANSHPVVNFSSQGIPCLFMKNHEEAKSFADQISATYQVVACVQTATLNLWELEVAEPQNYFSEGFAVHPAKIALSLPVAAAASHPLIVEEETPTEVKELIVQVRSQNKEEAIQALNALESHPWVTQLAPRIATLTDQLAATPVEGGLPLLAILELIERQRIRAFEEVRLSLNSGKRLHPLFWQKTLEATLIGNEKSLGLGQHALIHAKSLANSLQTLIDYQKQLDHPAHLSSLLLDGVQQAPFAEIADGWKGFLLSLELSIHDQSIPEADINEFKELISILKQSNVLPTWLLTTFQPQLKVDGAAPQIILKAFIAQLSADEKIKLKRMLNEQRLIREEMSQIEQFADPKLFFKVLERFKEIVKHFSDHAMINEYLDQSSSIVQIVTLQSMELLAAFGDAAIKSMKSGQAFEEPKVKIFKEMIAIYKNIFSDWVIAREDQMRLDSNKEIKAYVRVIEKIFGQLDDNPNQLLPSRDFFVNAALFGSDAHFYDHLPETLEDVFTLIHQNLIQFVEWENQKFLSDIVWNSRLKEILEIDEFKEKEISGVSINSKGVNIKYNFPLRNHSLQLEVKYDRMSDRVIFTYSFFGEGEMERWNIIATWASLLDDLDYLKIVGSIKEMTRGVSFSWDIPNKKAVIDAIAIRERFVASTYTRKKISDQQFSTLIPDGDINVLAPKIITTAIKLLDQQPTIANMLLRNLITGGYAITEVEATVDKLLNLNPKMMLVLLSILVANGYSFNRAEIAAFQFINKFPVEAETIFKQLVEKGHSIDIIKTTANDLLEQQPETAVILFGSLIAGGYAVIQAEAVIDKLLNLNSETALKLLGVLVRHGYSFAKAAAGAIKFIDSFPLEAMMVIEELINAKYFTPDIETIAIRLMNERHSNGFKLIKNLMNNGCKSIAPKVGDVAMKLLMKGHYDFASPLFELLIDTKHEITLVEDAINKLFVVDFFKGKKLFRDLTDEYIANAEAIAFKFLDENPMKAMEAMSLFRILINSGRFPKTAETVAIKLFNKNSQFAETLLVELVETNRISARTLAKSMIDQGYIFNKDIISKLHKKHPENAADLFLDLAWMGKEIAVNELS